MKILCVCQQGDNRSVHLAYFCKKMGHDAIAVGYDTMTTPSLKELVKWSDLIAVVDETSESKMRELGGDIVVFPIGKDRFERPLNKELLSIIETNFNKVLNNLL